MNKDYREIRSFLGSVSRLEWLNRATAGLLRLGVVAAVVLCVDVLVVEKIIGRPWAAFSLALIGTLSIWFAAARLIAPLVRPLSRHRSGRLMESRRRELGNDVVSSLHLGARLEELPEEGSASPSLVRGLLGSTAEKLGKCRPGSFISWKPARFWALRFLVAAIPVFALAYGGQAVSPAAIRALADPTVYWPLGKVSFEVDPGNARILRGSDLAVTARVSGPVPGSVTLAIDEEGGGERLYLMTRREEKTFSYGIRGVGGDFRYRVLSAAAGSPSFTVETVEQPTAGSFEARYTYPAYTGLDGRLRAGNGGLEALRGTAVDLSFTVNRELSEGRLFLGERAYEVTSAGGLRYGASFYLDGESGYRLELTDVEGFRNSAPLEYAIRYLNDAPPEVELVSPVGEVDLGPLGQIPVLFQASDDYGLSRVSLVYRNSAGEAVREQIFTGPSKKSVGGEYFWDVTALEARPGSLLHVFLEAADNDTITGPKVSLSASFILRVPDPGEEHRKTEELLEELIDDLVDLLADEMDLLGRYEEQARSAEEEWEEFSWEETAENEAARQAVEEAAENAASAMASLEQQMSVDPMTRPEALFQAGLMKRQLNEMRQLSLAPMKDLSRSLDPDESTQGEMSQKTDFLEKYAEEAVEATEQMVLTAEQMQREQNMADMEGSGREMMDLQEELMRSLENLKADDREAVEEVLDSLDEVEKMLQDLMEALAEKSPDLPEEFLNSDALKEMPFQEAMDALEQIRQMLREGDIEGAKKAAGELLKSLSDMMNRLEQASEDFENRAQEAIDRLKKFTVPAIDGVIKEQQEILKKTEDLDGKIADGRESREAGPESVPEIGESELAESEVLSGAEKELQERTEGLAAEAAALKAALPFLSPEIEGSLSGAAGDMEEAAGSLGRGSAVAALPQERSALAKLMNARDRARQSLQAMEQMQGYRKGKGGMVFMSRGMPGSAPGASSSPSKGTRSGGRLGTNVRNFRIPGKEDYEVPPLFRSDILESLRDGYPAPYEERIRDYFQRIAE
jgi:hypothetical protein